MSGANDQTDGTQAAETDAAGTGSEQELTPEAEAEAETKAAWEEFTGKAPEDTDDDSGTGGDAGAEAAGAESGQDPSDTDGGPPSEAGEGEGESSTPTFFEDVDRLSDWCIENQPERRLSELSDEQLGHVVACVALIGGWADHMEMLINRWRAAQ